MVLFEMTIANPKVTTNLVSNSPQNALQTALISTKNPEFINHSKTNNITEHYEDDKNEDDNEEEDDEEDDENDDNNDDNNDDDNEEIYMAPVEVKHTNKSVKKLTKTQQLDIKKTIQKDNIIAKAKAEILALKLTKDQINSDNFDGINSLEKSGNMRHANGDLQNNNINNINSLQPSHGNDAKLDRVMAKLAQLEATLQEKNTNTIPEFLKKMMAQNKYIDRDGMVRDAMSGDMKYSQLDPSQHQAPIHPAEDDKWDYAGYSILPPHVWRPRKQNDVRDHYQENICPVCPMMTSGNTTNLAEWDDSRYVIGSDDISIDYIKELNRRKI